MVFIEKILESELLKRYKSMISPFLIKNKFFRYYWKKMIEILIKLLYLKNYYYYYYYYFL